LRSKNAAPILSDHLRNRLPVIDILNSKTTNSKENTNTNKERAISASLPKKVSFFLFTLSIKLLFIIGVISSFILLTLNDLPSTSELSSTTLKAPLRVFSAENELIAEFGDERRKNIDLNQAPEHLLNSILASEDTNFYKHFGIDFKGILRAVIKNVTSGSKQGASTITQQVARNYFLSSEQTYKRKLKEVMLAFKLEATLSKDEILNLYINKIFLGHRSYGFAAA